MARGCRESHRHPGITVPKTTSQHSPVTQALKFSLSTGRQDRVACKERKGKVLLEEEKFLCTLKPLKLNRTQGIQRKHSTLSSLPSPLPYHLPP